MILTDHENFWRAVLERNLLYHKELDRSAADVLRGTLGNIFPGLPLSLINFPSTERENRRCLISQSVHPTEVVFCFGFFLTCRGEPMNHGSGKTTQFVRITFCCFLRHDLSTAGFTGSQRNVENIHTASVLACASGGFL